MNVSVVHSAPSPLAMPAETLIVGHRMVVYPETDSTNNRALATSGDGVVIVAESQTAGRGRHGRQWHSAPGLGLWFSVGMDGDLPGLTFAAALAVRDALASDVTLRVKWPNDLLLNGKKVCGILVEHRHGRTALGIGINLYHRPEDLPPALRDTATSVYMETGQRLDRSDVLKPILEHLDRRILALRLGHLRAIREEWSAACNLIGKRVRVCGVEGTIRSVNDTGALELVSAAHGILWITAEIIELERME